MKPEHALWQLVYRAFEQNGNKAAQVVFAAAQDMNEVQFRLLHAIAALKAAEDLAERRAITGQIEADIMVAEAAGWLATDTAAEAIALTQQIKNQ